MSKFKEYLEKVRVIKEDADSEGDLIAIDKNGNEALDIEKADGFKIVIGKLSEGKNFLLGKNATVQDVYNKIVETHDWIKSVKRPTNSLVYVGSKDSYTNKLKEWLKGENYSLTKLNETQGPFKEGRIEFDIIPTDKLMNPKVQPKVLPGSNKPNPNAGKRYSIEEMKTMIENEKKMVASGKPSTNPTYICITYVRDAKPTN